MLGCAESAIKPGRVSYELRRLRLHGLIERIAKSHRYRLTRQGLRTVMFYQRTYARLLRPGLSIIHGAGASADSKLVRSFQKLEAEIDDYITAQAA